jgi:Flp pilus assembly protein TadG
VTRRPRARNEQGFATTEAVLVTPVLLFLVMVVIQFGLWFHAQHVATAAAEEGARAARAEHGSADAGRDSADAFLGQAAPRLIVDPNVSASRTLDVVTVEVDGETASVIPGLSFPVRAAAKSPVERFREDPG